MPSPHPSEVVLGVAAAVPWSTGQCWPGWKVAARGLSNVSLTGRGSAAAAGALALDGGEPLQNAELGSTAAAPFGASLKGWNSAARGFNGDVFKVAAIESSNVDANAELLAHVAGGRFGGVELLAHVAGGGGFSDVELLAHATGGGRIGVVELLAHVTGVGMARFFADMSDSAFRFAPRASSFSSAMLEAR